MECEAQTTPDKMGIFWFVMCDEEVDGELRTKMRQRKRVRVRLMDGRRKHFDGDEEVEGLDKDKLDEEPNQRQDKNKKR